MTGIPELRSLKKWRGSKWQVVSIESGALAPIDVQAPIPFHDELQRLYDAIELRLERVPQKVIAVTSATHGEGNSTIAAYLALLLYRKGNGFSTDQDYSRLPVPVGNNRVLLIDANFRRPAIHKLFNIQNDVGFSEILQHKVDMEKSMDTRHATKLTIVTAGQAIHSVQPFLKTGSLTRYIHAFKQYYNYIVLDTAPVIPYGDTLAMGRVCDGVIFNILAEHTRREVVQRAKERLDEARVPVLGAVLNQRRYHIPQFIYELI